MKQIIRNPMALIIGAMIGVAVMWLMAPMSGTETRRILSENLTSAQDKANTAIEDAQEKVRQISDAGRRVVEEKKSTLEQGAEKLISVVKRS